MNKQTGLIIGVVALVVLAGVGVLAFGGLGNTPRDTVPDALMAKDTGTPSTESTMKKEETPMAPESETAESEAAMKQEAGSTAVPTAPAAQPAPTPTQVAGAYEAYAPEKLARAETGDVVLFFHASWCPSCRGLNADIEANAASIPSGVSILKVDYDTETELKKKYGVTTQHTLVQVDAAGNQIKKWSGSSKLSALVSQVQ